jgi:hypothetical protein
MTTFKSFKSPLLILSLILVNLIATSPFSEATPPLTKCNIKLDNPHYSKSVEIRKGFKAIKVNARSRCNRQMTNLVLTVEIHKIGFLRDYKVATEEIKVQGPILPNAVIKNQKTYVECKNSKSSRYYGEAYASALIKGERVRTLHVLTEKTITVNCGN